MVFIYVCRATMNNFSTLGSDAKFLSFIMDKFVLVSDPE